MNSPQVNEDEFAKEIAKQTERRKASSRKGVWQGLSQVGTVGWMIALPGVGGAFLGRWIDERYRTGIFWTLSLLIGGLAIGCMAAWRSMNRELRG